MGKAKPKNWIVGRWLIESMDQWDRDFIDEEVRGYFEFDAKDSGDFQFGYVQGQIDYRFGEGAASLPSSLPGTAMTRWTRLRGVAGWSSTAMN